MAAGRQARRETEPRVLAPPHLLTLGALLLLLVYAAVGNFKLFHTAAELFAVFVSVAIFVVAWQARPVSSNPFTTLAGPALLLVGGLDLLHALSFEGVEMLALRAPDASIQLWIAARLLEGVALATAMVLPRKWLRRMGVVWAVAGFAVLELGAILLGLFPACFVPGQGLTPFKVGAEALVAGCKLLGAVVIARRQTLDPQVRWMVAAALVLSAASELAFMTYADVQDQVVVLGHLLKVAAFYLLYRVVAHVALAAPIHSLFSDLENARSTLEGRVASRTRELARANAVQRLEMTARIEMEDRLREAKAALEAVFRASPLAIVVTDKENQVVMWNRAAERLFGWSAKEAVGGPVPGGVAAVLGRGSLEGTEAVCRCRDGRDLEVRVFSAPVYDPRGAVIGAVSVIADITAEKLALHALAEKEARLRAILDGVSDALLTVSEDGRVESVNPSGQRMFGRSEDDLRETHLAELVGLPGGREGLEALSRRAPFETSAWRDGTRLSVEMAVSPIETGKGRQFVVVLRDVTERVRAAEERAALQQQLAQAQKMEALGNLAGSIAHEVNNMLVPILGLTQSVADRFAKESRERRALETVVQAAERTRAIVRQVLTFSRAAPAPAGRLALAQTVREAVPLLRSALPSSIEIDCAVRDAHLVIRADPTRLHQVLLNLAANAAHAIGPKGGRVGIILERCRVEPGSGPPGLRPGWHARLRFSDTGHGMSPEIAQKIFEPFFTTKAVGEGTGMGLSVVHGIVTAWGGAIEVETAPGQGTSFLIYLPLDESSGEIVIDPAAAAAPETE